MALLGGVIATPCRPFSVAGLVAGLGVGVAAVIDRFFWSSTTDTLNSDLAFVQNFGNPIGFGGENDRLLKCCVAARVIAVWSAQ